MFNRMIEKIEAHKERSAWGNGVKAYALELVKELEERSQYEGRTPATRKECEAWLLNGAQDWKAFSWGGSSLIYNGDIARACAALPNSRKPATANADLTAVKNGLTLKPVHCSRLPALCWVHTKQAARVTMTASRCPSFNTSERV